MFEKWRKSQTTPEAPSETGAPANISEVETPGRNWWMIGAGAAVLVLGVVFGNMWSSNSRNMLLAFATITAWPGGVYLVYRGWRKPASIKVVVPGKAKAEPAMVNSLNIYAKKTEDGRVIPSLVAFEWIDKPQGQPQQCINDGKWYYVHIWDLEKAALVPFSLPDSQYFDPREFANVIRMPAHRKLFERQATLLQQVAPGIMLLALVIAIFGLIATTPSGG